LGADDDAAVPLLIPAERRDVVFGPVEDRALCGGRGAGQPRGIAAQLPAVALDQPLQARAVPLLQCALEVIMRQRVDLYDDEPALFARRAVRVLARPPLRSERNVLYAVVQAVQSAAQPLQLIWSRHGIGVVRRGILRRRTFISLALRTAGGAGLPRLHYR